MQSSKFTLLLGILLIIAAPVMPGIYFANTPHADALQTGGTEAIAGVVSKKATVKYDIKDNDIRSDSDYTLHLSIRDTATVNADNLQVNIDTSLSDSAQAWQRKLIAESLDSLEGKELYTDVLVSKEDYRKYRAGDTVHILYMTADPSTAKLKKHVAFIPTGKKESGKWLLASGLTLFFGIALIAMYRRRKKQEQQEDVLSSFTTYSSIKKNEPGKGGRPTDPF